MRRAALVALVVLSSLVGWAGWTAAEDKKIAWVLDYEAGVKAAKEAKKPIFVDFMAEW
ncbi:MAG: hypothetical protein HYZ53_21405 [Planctomycetes bacterium]|nr:hypothetical protein [Planctomycetota bacterium]